MYQNEKFTTSPDAQPMIKFHICPKIKSTPLPAKPAERPYPASPGQRSPYSGRFPYPARLDCQRFPHSSPSRQVPVFRLVPPTEDPHSAPPDRAPLFHLTRQEVPTSRLTRQRFPHSSPTKQVPVFRSGPKFPDCKKTPPSFKNGGVSLIQTSDYSAAEVSSSTLYSAMCSNRLRFSLTFS